MTEQRKRMVAYLLLTATVALALTGLRTVLDRLETQNRAHAAQEQQAAEEREDIKQLLEEVQATARNAEAAAADARAAVALIEDCTTPGGTCYAEGQKRTSAAVNDIVRRLSAALERLGDLSAQNTALQRQVAQLAAEAASLRAYVEQVAQEPDRPAPPPPPTPLLCQLVRC